MTIGIIGSGEMGKCLASKFVKLGHTVAIANSRGPDSLSQLAEGLGAKAASVEEVIKNNQVIIVSIPQKNISMLPGHLFKDLPKNVVVIDTGNYYPNLRDGCLQELEQSGVDSMWVQEQLGLPVVKVFNSILATSINDLDKPKGDKDRIAMAVSGDDKTAKEVVIKLVDELGFDAVDLGAISQSWRQQPGSPIYCRDLSSDKLKERIAAMQTKGSDMHSKVLAKRKTDEILMREDYAAYLKNLRD